MSSVDTGTEVGGALEHHLVLCGHSRLWGVGVGGLASYQWNTVPIPSSLQKRARGAEGTQGSGLGVFTIQVPLHLFLSHAPNGGQGWKYGLAEFLSRIYQMLSKS